MIVSLPKDASRTWFWRTLSRDAFVIASVTWMTLFVLELIKPRLVSNYLSLTDSAFLLVLLALIHLSLRPAIPATKMKPSRNDLMLLGLGSAVAAGVIALSVSASSWLTLLLVFVTVGTIWAGTFQLWDL